jgi:hypothetical protein
MILPFRPGPFIVFRLALVPELVRAAAAHANRPMLMPMTATAATLAPCENLPSVSVFVLLLLLTVLVLFLLPILVFDNH